MQKKGYWPIPLDEESAKLTTMNTPLGRYKSLRLSFGIHSAQEVFHRIINESFIDMLVLKQILVIFCFGARIQKITTEVSLHHWRE